MCMCGIQFHNFVFSPEKNGSVSRIFFARKWKLRAIFLKRESSNLVQDPESNHDFFFYFSLQCFSDTSIVSEICPSHYRSMYFAVTAPYNHTISMLVDQILQIN